MTNLSVINYKGPDNFHVNVNISKIRNINVRISKPMSNIKILKGPMLSNVNI